MNRQEISRIVTEALQRPERERERFLDEACAGDAALRDAVDAGLAGVVEATAPSGRRPAWPGAQDARIGPYRILSQLGAGGMGEVYCAHDERLDREIAIKVLPPAQLEDPTARERLLREARAAAALNHPNVCTVHEVGEADGRSYIAMELVEGRTLSAILAAGALSHEQVVRYGSQLAEALAHAHQRGVIHRDLKSQNIIITADDRLKVLDFGLAKRWVGADAQAVTGLLDSLTHPGTIVGTLPYMAPEQLRGERVQASADVWAFGVVLYEMASGLLPFRGQTAFEVSGAILNHPPPSLPDTVSPAVRAVVERCLAKVPADRYGSAAEVRTAIAKTLSPGAGRALRLPPPATEPPLVLRVSRRTALRMGGVALAAGAAISVWGFWPSPVAMRTLAVLPLDNPLGDDDLEYLCDGIAESLIARMAGLPAVRVTPLSAVLPLKDPPLEPAAAGRRLGVSAVLAGTLERDGTQLLIDMRLIDVDTGRQLWAGRYDRDETALMDLQDEVASAIFEDGLRVRLTQDERRRLVRHPTTDGEAYDLYLQARHLQRHATEEDYLHSRELLQRAVVRDPAFALAYAALSGNYAMMVTDGLERPTDAWPQVNRYARQALEIDPELPEALAFTHALAFLFDWDWAGAARARERLLGFPLGAIDPHVLRAMALEHWALGRVEEALQLARRTRELDPLSGYLAVLEADYVLRSGRPDEAIALYEHSIRLDPGNPNAYFGLAEARARQGRFDEALEARDLAHALAGDDRLEPLFAEARGEEGYRRIEEAWIQLQLEALRERESTRYVSPLDFARAYAQSGETEPAFEYLDRAFADRAPGLVFLNVDPAWDRLRDDPRFATAVRRVGLP